MGYVINGIIYYNVFIIYTHCNQPKSVICDLMGYDMGCTDVYVFLFLIDNNISSNMISLE